MGSGNIQCGLHLQYIHQFTMTQAQQSLSLSCDDQAVTIQIEDSEHFTSYRGVYGDENLPIQFRIIFENHRQFYNFLAADLTRIRLSEQQLRVEVHLVGKVKTFSLPLDRLEQTISQQLLSEIHTTKERLSECSDKIAKSQEQLQRQIILFQEKRMISESLQEFIKDRQSENLQLAGKVRHLEARIDEILQERDRQKCIDTSLMESRLTQEFTPVKKLGGKSKKVREKEEFGTKIHFKIDETAKHFNKFRYSNNEIQKLHGPTYQLYHCQAIPRQGKFHFDLRVVMIRNNNIVVGVISERKKDDQFSFKKLNCLCYNGYDGSVCEQEKIKYVGIKPKEGNRIRTVVDIANAMIQWHMLGPDSQRTFIGRIGIPSSMTRQPLYPYFELYWEGNRIRLNS